MINTHLHTHKLKFTSSAPVKWSGRGLVSVPALPWRGSWAVTKLNEHNISVTYIPRGEKIYDVTNLRKGRLICAVLNALTYYWDDYPKHMHEFCESVWWEWLQEVRQ